MAKWKREKTVGDGERWQPRGEKAWQQFFLMPDKKLEKKTNDDQAFWIQHIHTQRNLQTAIYKFHLISVISYVFMQHFHCIMANNAEWSHSQQVTEKVKPQAKTLFEVPSDFIEKLITYFQ